MTEVNKRSDTGFTLIQLVILTVVIGILSVVAVPIITDTLGSTRIYTAAQRIVSDIQEAQSFAKASHDSVWVVFDVVNDEYSLYRGEDNAVRDIQKHPVTGDDWIVSFQVALYRGVDITSASFGGSTELLFDSWGDATSGGTVVLNNSVTVQVTELTGRTTISP
ncbi:MAG: GspH/FimT family pseudopilin [Candidatus Neomarinimicrobiota bacterium]